MKNWWKLIAAILGCEAVGVLGSFFTVPAIGGWYNGLNKPAVTPPNWVFGLVWSGLFFLMGVALYKVLLKKTGTRAALAVFGLQLLLNLLWSVIFFGWHQPRWVMVEIMILWGAILLTIREFEKVSVRAAVLLIPYVLWVSWAAVLNFGIVILN